METTAEVSLVTNSKVNVWPVHLPDGEHKWTLDQEVQIKPRPVSKYFIL